MFFPPNIQCIYRNITQFSHILIPIQHDITYALIRTSSLRVPHATHGIWTDALS